MGSEPWRHSPHSSNHNKGNILVRQSYVGVKTRVTSENTTTDQKKKGCSSDNYKVEGADLMDCRRVM